MTPHSLFNITLKTLGLIFIKDIITTFTQIISSILYLAKSNTFDDVLLTLIYTVLILGVYISISYLLILKTHWIIDKLQLDKGFNQEVFTFNITLLSVLTIAVIVVGAFVLVTEIPNLCRCLYTYCQQKTNDVW
jgi:hypothetical protein